MFWSAEYERQRQENLRKFFLRICVEAEQDLFTHLIKDALKDQTMDKKSQAIILTYLREKKNSTKNRERNV